MGELVPCLVARIPGTIAEGAMDETEEQHDSEECLSGALELAEAKYARFVNKSLREREQLFDSLPRNQQFGGRAHSLQDAFLKTTEKRVRKWAAIYKRVAREQGCPALLSNPQLDRLRKRMLASIKAAEAALVDRVMQDAAAAGDANQLVVQAWEKGIRRTFQATLLEVVNAELRVSEAVGKATFSRSSPLEAATVNDLSLAKPSEKNSRYKESYAHTSPNPPSGSPVVRGGFPSTNAWEDIEICFLSDERVQIATGESFETRNYAEMGFANQKNGKPRLSWIVLRELAKSHGVMQVVGSPAQWPVIEKRMQELRRNFKSLFGLTDDPLPFTRKTNRHRDDFGYGARFKIRCGPSYDS